MLPILGNQNVLFVCRAELSCFGIKNIKKKKEKRKK
jgi:hypothetical protein